MSDNGPEPLTKESKALPFRGKKWSALEGGTRVPCLLRFPGVLPAGKESDALISAIDLLPTLAHACSIDLGEFAAGFPVIDGLNVWNTLLGDNPKAHPRKNLLYWHGANGFQAIRHGTWKLFMNSRDAGLKSSRVHLFNLENDQQEMRDLSADHPAIVSKLQTGEKTIVRNRREQDRPGKNKMT